MTAYADTGFVCSLHTPDAHTARVLAFMKRQRRPLPFTALHRLEFRNALRLRVFRKEITSEQCEQSIQAMLSDVAGGIFTFADVNWPEMLLEAERLSARHTETIGTRSLDILHVAAASVLGCRDFLTFDHRQGALAAAAGLQVPALK
jgi:predicted nucleic acid-binding protein